MDYTVDVQTTVEAFLVNGEEFGGSRIAYFPNRFVRFTLTHEDVTAPVISRIGNAPALQMAALGDGLHIAAYQSTAATLTYEDWERFQRFVDHKAFGNVRAEHDARGLPDADFVEVYIRFSKSLIAVGEGAGADERVGLETEIVALANPYTDDVSAGLPVQVWYGDEVRAGAQVELFAKAEDGSVEITLHTTDADGIALLPVQSGFSYMADAVVLRVPSAELSEANRGAVWETLWANLTFAVP